MYVDPALLIAGAIILFMSGGVFGVMIMAVMNVASKADREEKHRVETDAPIGLKTRMPEDRQRVNDEIRSSPYYTENFKAFLSKYHPDVLEDPMTKLTTDIHDEYMAWCQTEEAQPYFDK